MVGEACTQRKKLASTGPLLDFRQAKFMQRLAARSRGHHGPEEILERRGAELTVRLRQSFFLEPKEKPEELERASHRRSQGGIKIDPKGEDFRVARDWQDTNLDRRVTAGGWEDRSGGGVVEGGES